MKKIFLFLNRFLSGNVLNFGFSFLLFLSLQLTSESADAQITIAAWNPASPTALSGYGPSPWSATTTAANVTVTGLTRGSGILLSGTAAGSAWGGVNWAGVDETAGIAAGSYATFTAKANTGYMVSFTSLSLYYRRSGTGPANGQLQYSTNGVTFTDISGGAFAYTNTTSTGALLTPAVDLSVVTALQNVPSTTTVTFRIVNWGGGSAGTWYVFNASGLQVTGMVNTASGCSGTPLAGSVSALPTSICGSGTATMTLTGGSTGTGISYQWSSSAASTPPGSNISGATNANYTPSSISATTYYWCTSTCATSSLTNISSGGTVTYNTLPSISVSPAGGNVCSGGSGLTMTASGASTYTWAPAVGLSASTGAIVISNPGSDYIYTVTGTATSGCAATQTVSVSSTPAPSALTMTPSSLTLCQGDLSGLLTAGGGLAGPAAATSGTLNLPVNIPHAVVPASFSFSNIPSGASITDASVTLNFSSSFVHDYIFNLVAPNGKVINLVNQSLPSGTGNFTNTIFSSSSAIALSSGSTPFTGTFATDAASAVGPVGYVSNTSSWPALYTIPNGTWQLIAYNSSTFTDVSNLVSWSLSLNYSYPVLVTWSPATQLYTNSAGTTGYTGANSDTVYLNPLVPAVVTYTATATNGTCATKGFVTTTVNPTSAITGVFTVCEGATTSLTDALPGGTWSSSNTSVATVGSGSGAVFGVVAGTATIVYTLAAGCTASVAVTVNPSPSAITGTMSVCEGLTTTMSNSITGGTWTSPATSVSTDAGTGIVTGLTAGTADISYTLSSGCYSTTTVVVNPSPAAITGVQTVCEGQVTGLTDAVAGGAWTSGITLVATVGSGSGIVSGILAGTSAITYSLPAGCSYITTVTVNPSPSIITGASSVCEGFATNLSDAIAGGTWNSSNTSVAVVGTSGTVTGIVAGTSVVAYTLSGGCTTFTTVAVNPSPGVITGVMSVCTGLTTALSDIISAGTWTSPATSISVDASTGVVTGLSSGTAVVTYALTAGCNATTTITVNPSPSGILGRTDVCEGLTITLSDPVVGGSWTSDNTTVATISTSSGIVSGIVAGTAGVTYTLPAGCFATATVTVNPLPAAISGSTNVCSGLTTALTDAGGGTWTSSNTFRATVGTSSGVVTGILGGSTTITYTLSTGCIALTTVSVYQSPPSITGITSVCSGLSTTLSNAVTGGTWLSAGTSYATIGSSSGIVTALSPGVSTIVYTAPDGCTNSTLLTVNALPSAISGSLSVCVGSITNLVDGGGGIWSSSSTSIATIVPGTGVVSGLALGTSTITYKLGTGCLTTAIVTVNPVPATIFGPSGVCEGSTVTLFDPGGGTWNSSDFSIASVDVATGVVTGVSAGTATIVYMLSSGCATSKTISVDPLPVPITGSGSVCMGSSVTLSDAGGGTWSSSDPLVATIGLGSGIVVGASAGTTSITYAFGTGCKVTMLVSVNPLPTTISGPSGICLGASSTLSDGTSGGTWTSSNTGILTIDPASGAMTTITAGSANIIYALATGCSSTKVIGVNPVPAAITGSSSVCVSSTSVLSDISGGGTWSSSNTSIATIGSGSGIVTGVGSGVPLISYTLPTGCLVYKAVTVNPLPAGIAGVTGICVGSTASLSDTGGGTWSSSNTTVATIGGGTGIVTAIAAGSATITYSLSTGCLAFATATVNPVVVPLVSIASSTGDTVCAGTLITFSATPVNGGSSPVFKWQVNGITAGLPASVYSYSPASGDVVTVMLTSTAPCAIPDTAVNSLTITVLANVTPTVTIAASPGNHVCEGSPVKFTASPVFGGAAPSYLWTQNGVNVATGPMYTYIPFNGDDVYCTMKSDIQCKLADPAFSNHIFMDVDLLSVPAFTLTVSPGTHISVAQADTFTAAVTTTGSYTYKWLVNGAAVAGATSSVFITSTLINNDSVTCVVTHANACALSTFNSVIMNVARLGIHASTLELDNISVLPNPSNGAFTVRGSLGSAEDQHIDMEVTDMMGRTVFRDNIMAVDGNINTLVRLKNNVANGLYNLCIRSGNSKKVFHIVIEQ